MAQDQAMAEAVPNDADAPPVVAFDFDGTLTVRDSFIEFLKWRAGKRRYLIGSIRLIPAALAYLFHRDRGRIKAALRGWFEAKGFVEAMEGELFVEDTPGGGLTMVFTLPIDDSWHSPAASALAASEREL